VQFSTVAVIDHTAELAERVTYTAYGRARHHWPADVDGDGDHDSTDQDIVRTLMGNDIDDPAYDAAADLNRDGTVSFADWLLASGTTPALAEGVLSDSSAGAPDNQIGYDGYVFNAEAELYTIRYRCYSSSLGRWLERDPLPYVDGLNLFEYASSSPSSYNDPSGLLRDKSARRRNIGDSGACASRDARASDRGQPLLPRREPTCPKIKQLEIDILDYGRYRTSWNWYRGCVILGEHEVNNVNEMINVMRNQIRDAEREYGAGCVCIKRLVIHGHGGPGVISVGAGAGAEYDSEDRATYPEGIPTSAEELSVANIQRLSEFSSYMCDGWSVRFYSCNVGLGVLGSDFLKAAANALNARAIGYDGNVNPYFPDPGTYEIHEEPDSIPSEECCSQSSSGSRQP
jgi:RHS repeat-associated protein